MISNDDMEAMREPTLDEVSDVADSRREMADAFDRTADKLRDPGLTDMEVLLYLAEFSQEMEGMFKKVPAS